MPNEDPKNLKDLLRPLKDLLEIIKSKVDKLETFQHVTMQQVRDIKDQQSVMNGKLDNIEERLDDPDTGLKRINDRLDVNSASLAVIELEIKGHGDAYKINDSNIRKMEKRLEGVERKEGIEVPPELQLAEIADI